MGMAKEWATYVGGVGELPDILLSGPVPDIRGTCWGPCRTISVAPLASNALIVHLAMASSCYNFRQ